MVKTLPIPNPATFSTSTSQRPYYDLRTLVQTQVERALDDRIDPGKEHQASNSVENEGKLNDLVERIKSNEFFKPIWGELYGMLKAELDDAPFSCDYPSGGAIINEHFYLGSIPAVAPRLWTTSIPVEKALATTWNTSRALTTAELNV